MTAAGPLFTVVVPLFDKAAHIGATLASVAAQTLDDYEVIVIDDGSRDDGPAQVEAVGGRVQLVRQANAGPGAARNRGIAEARGVWIAFLDADDLWRPEHLATLAATIAACPDADIVATGYERATTRYADAAKRTPDAARYIDFFSDYGRVWTSAVAVRAAVLRDMRFGHVWPGEDVELWIRLALRHRIAVNPASTAIYVQQTGGAMDSGHGVGATAIADQPVFATIAEALADPTLAPRYEVIAAFRNALLIDYIRPALFGGHTALVRDYLRVLRQGGGRAPWLYRVLARLPDWAVYRGTRSYGAIKRRLGRRA